MNHYGNSQYQKSEEQRISTNEIRQQLQNHIAFSDMEKEFGKLMDELHKEVSDFSDSLDVEYHIVIFNREQNTRFTILETKQGIGSFTDEDNKANNYGLVGKLFTRIVLEDFLMIQYGYYSSDPKVYHYSEKGIVEEMPEYMQNKFWDNEEKKKFYWASTGKRTSSKDEEKRKFAISAMLFYEEGKKLPLGAITLDFNTQNKKYPNFAFRNNEIQIIYRTLYRMKSILEIMLSKKIMQELDSAIKLAKQGDKSYENM